MGWFWAAYSFGIGVFGAYLPSFTIPMVGEYYSLWLSLPFSIAGLLICLLMVPKSKGSGTSSMSNADKLRELSRGVTILVHNRQIALAAVVRVICNLTLYGFPVIMPLYLATTNNGGGAWFKVSQWSQIWGFQFVVTIFGNVFWGRMGDSYGWMRQMRWFGCWFCVIGTLGMYYIPQFSGRIWCLCALMRLFLDWEFPLSFLWEPCFPRWRWNIRVLRFPRIISLPAWLRFSVR